MEVSQKDNKTLIREETGIINMIICKDCEINIKNYDNWMCDICILNFVKNKKYFKI